LKPAAESEFPKVFPRVGGRAGPIMRNPLDLGPTTRLKAHPSNREEPRWAAGLATWRRH